MANPIAWSLIMKDGGRFASVSGNGVAQNGLFGETRKNHTAFLMLVDGRSKILSRKYS